MGPPLHGRVAGNSDGDAPSYTIELVELCRVIVVGAVPLGILCAAGLSRLAMYVLRLTSDDAVRGRVTDDGFTVGDVTLFGFYNLASLGVAVGVVGGAAYVAVSPWLLGGPGLRSLTVGVTAGVVVGPAVLHPQGFDLAVLEPTWLAVASFVAIPTAFGCAVVPLVDRAARAERGLARWAAQGRRRWLVPVLLVAPFPVAWPIVAVVLAVVAALLPVRRALLDQVRRSPAATWGIRAAYAVVPVLGVVALLADVRALA